jgi:hypothetical protein
MRAFSLILPLLALACVPDYADDSKDGSVDGSDGSDGADGTDGSDGSDGTDGTDGEPVDPVWVGSHTLLFAVEAPWGALCEGEVEVEVNADGIGDGASDCPIEFGPGAGESVPFSVHIEVAGLSDDEDVDGEVALPLQMGGGPGGGDTLEPGPLSGSVDSDGFDLEFEISGLGWDGSESLTGTLIEG